MKPLKIALSIIFLAIFFAAGAVAGYFLLKPPSDKTVVTAQVILTALRDQGFLVTQTYIFDEPVTIEKTSGSAFKDFFFGQTITARGTMEANLGIDLSRVTFEDVLVENDKIIVKIPQAKVFNVRLIGPLDVKNTQGILKRLLENEEGYNEAQAELTKAAEQAALRPEFIDRATNSAKEEVARLVGYVARDKTVEVQVKK
ncbi:MAG TPA: DUF4230 domain-containing protein [bacterium]|nr:MAG: hypothetical protein BWY14_00067 [Parcubacteria group bacterium ADurb.Bin192]HPN14632.1 DUF4230 domain-containing protein [bacterium]